MTASLQPLDDLDPVDAFSLDEDPELREEMRAAGLLADEPEPTLDPFDA